MFKKLTMMIAASALAFGANAAAQDDEQPPFKPSVAPQAAGAWGGTTMWAFINADGTHASDAGLGLKSSSNPSTGVYTVVFQRVIGTCLYLPSIAQQSSGTTHGFINAVQLGVDNKGLYIETEDATGAPANRDFSVLVSCYK